MGILNWLNNDQPPSVADKPGDPHGLELQGEETFSRSLAYPMPSAWDGWPAEWWAPNWQGTLQKLVDVAWWAIDLNSSILASLPVYRLRAGQIIDPPTWMINPDETIYTGWPEFAKELFWDYMCTGEAFVYAMTYGSDGWPVQFRVMPPWVVNVEMGSGRREYTIAGQPADGDILHIRYQSTTADARGHGPLEVAGYRMTAAALLQRYAHRLAETGGTPHYWLGVERKLDQKQADDLLAQWVQSRTTNAGRPALLSGGTTLNQLQSMNAKDMALLELSQFNESRIAVALGVPPFLMGLPAGSGGDGSLTYSNQEQLFSFHDRAGLRTKVVPIMSALSNWALPRGQTCELNRDEYTRPGFKERTEGYKNLAEINAINTGEIRAGERLYGPSSATALTGGGNAFNQQPQQQPTNVGAVPPNGSAAPHALT